MKSSVLAIVSRFLREDQGALHSVEFILIGTLVSIGVIVGLTEYRNAVVQEYGDVAASLLHLDQSWTMEIVTSVSPTVATTTYSYTDTMTYSALDANGITVNSSGSVE